MSAIFSADRRYRYQLDRAVGFFNVGPIVGIMGHNPSTAGEDVDDRTSQRAIGFAKSMRARSLVMINPWAGIATKPTDLWAMNDPVGPENDWHIDQVVREIRATKGVLILAWGKVNPPARLRRAVEQRLYDVRHMVAGVSCVVLGLNRDLSPKHPLYLPKTTTPIKWDVENWSAA
jgi:hypothetical protein